MLGDFAGAAGIINRMNDEDTWWAVESITAILVLADRKTEAISFAHEPVGGISEGNGLARGRDRSDRAAT